MAGGTFEAMNKVSKRISAFEYGRRSWNCYITNSNELWR